MRGASVVAALAAVVMAVPAFGCDKDAKKTAKLISDTKVAAAPSGCCKSRVSKAVEQVMKGLPTMTYKVGDFETSCSKSASAKAGEKGAMQYVVDGKTYDSKSEAVVALADRLDSEVKLMSAVRFSVGDEAFCCPMTAGKVAKNKKVDMKYRVGGIDFASREQADKAAKLVASMMSTDVPAATTLASTTANTPCSKSKTVAATSTAPCSKSKTVAATSTTAPCSKSKTVAATSTAPCSKSKAVAATVSPCSKSNTASATTKTVAAAGTKPCQGSGKPCCQGSDKPCCQGKMAAAKGASATTVAAAAPGCHKAGKVVTREAKTAAAAAPCCDKAEARLTSVQAKIRQMVETAATAL